MKTKIFPISLIVTFVIIFFVFYMGLNNSNIYTPSLNVEKKIPSFEAKIFNTSQKISSDAIFDADKYYLMNIWSSWCVPCLEEHPHLVSLSKLKNIEIIGLNYKDNNKKAKLFLSNLYNPYKIVFSDPDGTIAIEWGAYGVPESFLIYNKRIIKKFIGPINKDLLTEIKEIIQ
jgi:cytochrome c biogenesis protein CcmG, thiol:disulfide interchange protein DsbE